MAGYPRMHAFNTHGHLLSCDKDGGHTIRFAIAKTPTLHTNLISLCFIERSYGRSKFYIDLCCPCDLDLDLHIWTLPVFSGDIPDVQIWNSYTKAFESYHLTDRQTDTTEIIYNTTSQVVNEIQK